MFSVLSQGFQSLSVASGFRLRCRVIALPVPTLPKVVSSHHLSPLLILSPHLSHPLILSFLLSSHFSLFSSRLQSHLSFLLISPLLSFPLTPLSFTFSFFLFSLLSLSLFSFSPSLSPLSLALSFFPILFLSGAGRSSRARAVEPG